MKKWKFDIRKSLLALGEIQILLLTTKLITIKYHTNLSWVIVLIPLWMIIISSITIIVIGLCMKFNMHDDDIDQL